MMRVACERSYHDADWITLRSKHLPLMVLLPNPPYLSMVFSPCYECTGNLVQNGFANDVSVCKMDARAPVFRENLSRKWHQSTNLRHCKTKKLLLELVFPNCVSSLLFLTIVHANHISALLRCGFSNVFSFSWLQKAIFMQQGAAEPTG